MNNTVVVMDGILRIVVVLVMGGMFLRIMEMVNDYFNKKDKE